MTEHIEKLLQHYQLTTANIFYHLPDHPGLIQTYLWQEYDTTPDFPNLLKFLNFWDKSLDGKLHSIEIAHCRMLQLSDFHLIDGEYVLQ